ncbi:hypothetical protein J2W23_004857 [Variovorax boronicumulans]|uniref:hypothetical protein n=1 Tax=Variovorax boronicumulans TaxID=436515 RepID=UPI00278718D3|nr:hypothetical protein [Variovorax boronicumulans]MDQ0016454.1 hypothetical protein [Variovorax boronicumulans]
MIQLNRFAGFGHLNYPDHKTLCTIILPMTATAQTNHLVEQESTSTPLATKNQGKEKNKNTPSQPATKVHKKEETQKDYQADFSTRIVNFHNSRCMKMWSIVMISLGYLPFSDLRDSLKEDSKKFKNDYKRRIRYLKGMLTPSPKNGLALLLSRHPATAIDAKAEDHYLDVLSAFSVLRQKYPDQLPIEVEALEASVVNIPLPPGSFDEAIEDETAKRDISNRITAGLNANMQKLLAELIQEKYGTLMAKTRDGIAAAMATDMKRSGLTRNVIQKQLDLILRGYEGDS